MRLALWTPRPARDWPARLLASAAEGSERVVPARPEVVLARPEAARPAVDLDLYHVANHPAYGFVYRALLERPGLVVLEDWNLHQLVFAETAGRGDADAYRREARRAHGDTGAFIADQVLRGLGGALPRLLPLNERVLEAAAVLVATRDEVRAAAAARLRRPVELLPGGAGDPGAAAGAQRLLALAREAPPLVVARAREATAARALEPTPLGRALAELRPRARALGLPGLPDGVEARVASLLPPPAAAGG